MRYTSEVSGGGTDPRGAAVAGPTALAWGAMTVGVTLPRVDTAETVQALLAEPEFGPDRRPNLAASTLVIGRDGAFAEVRAWFLDRA